MLSLLFITFEKFAAVKNLTKYLNIQYSIVFCIISTMCFLSAVLSTIPNIIFKNYSSRYPLCFSLHLTNENLEGWLYSFCLFSIFPIIIISIILYFYLKIFKEVQSSIKILSRRDAIKRISSILISALSVVTTNIVVWLPILLLSLTFSFNKHFEKFIFFFLSLSLTFSLNSQVFRHCSVKVH